MGSELDGSQTALSGEYREEMEKRMRRKNVEP
jgi:hypothetical protein